MYDDSTRPIFDFCAALFIIGVIIGGIVLLGGCGDDHKAQASAQKEKWPPDGVSQDGNIFYVDNRLYDNRLISIYRLCDKYFKYLDGEDVGVSSITRGATETTVICIAWPT